MKKRLLITSVVMMLVVAVALSTATYAWFSSNATVTANAVTLTAATSDGDSILLSLTALDNATAGKTSDTLAPAAGALYPATPNSADFWKKASVSSFDFASLLLNGASYADKTSELGTSTFNTVEGTANLPYYTDEIYIYNSGASAITLNGTTVNISYKKGAANVEAVESVRIAIIEQVGTATENDTVTTFADLATDANAKLVGIYQVADASAATIEVLRAADGVLPSTAQFDPNAVYCTVSEEGEATYVSLTSGTFADALAEENLTIAEDYQYVLNATTTTSDTYGVKAAEDADSAAIKTLGFKNAGYQCPPNGFRPIGAPASGYHICNKYTVIMWLEGWDTDCTNAAQQGVFNVGFTFKKA